MPIIFENLAESHEAYERNFMIDGKHSPMLRTDESRIMQVLIGLQSNALKFTTNGHVRTIVQIKEDQDGHKEVIISVEDTGIGITKKNQTKLFKLFGFIQDSKQMNT